MECKHTNQHKLRSLYIGYTLIHTVRGYML